MSETEIKTALITGATSGIGKAFAYLFAKAGYNLVITGRREKIIQPIAEKIAKKYGVSVEVLIIELSNQLDLDELVQNIKEINDLEVLVNNAGFATRGTFVENDFSQQEAMVRVHILTVMKLTHAALPNMLLRKKGIIINVSSMGAYVIMPHNTVYCGTKAFITAFTESLHLELLNTGILVQVLCPGFVVTDFHRKMGFNIAKFQKNRGLIRWMTPKEVVTTSIRDLARGKVVSIPGKSNQLLYFISRFSPRQMYYRLVLRNLKKMASSI